MKKFLALSLSDVVFSMLINVKMPTIVGILKFMSRLNFVLSWVEYEKKFITSGPGFFATNSMYFLFQAEPSFSELCFSIICFDPEKGRKTWYTIYVVH